MNNTLNHSGEFTTTGRWLIGFAFAVLSIFGCTSPVILLPCMKRHPKMIESLLQMFLGLATGTLIGTAVFQFLPQCLHTEESSKNSNNLVLKAEWLVIFGFFIFILLDQCIRLVQPHLDESPPEESAITNTSEMPLTESGAVDGSDSKPIAIKVRKNLKKKFAKIKPVAWMILLVESLHKFIDGLSIGSAFSIDISDGISVSLAIFTEELAHGLGDFSILLHANMRPKQALFAIVVTALPCVFGYIAGMVLEQFKGHNYIFATAAGTFLYIALACLTPEAIENVAKCEKRRYVKVLENMFGMICGLLIAYVLEIVI